MRSAAVVLVVAFAACCVAVPLGAFTSIDRWAVDHAMPWISPFTAPTSVSSVLLPFNGRTPGAEIPADLWLYAASVPISALVVAGCCAELARRDRQKAALAWAGAWVLANALEALGKHALTRPTLTVLQHGEGVAIPGFDNSFPSGHASRAVVVAALVALVWPRLRIAAAVWLAVALPLLVVTNAHVPSDILGAVLLAGALAAVALEVSDPSPAPAPAARASRSADSGRRPST